MDKDEDLILEVNHDHYSGYSTALSNGAKQLMIKIGGIFVSVIILFASLAFSSDFKEVSIPDELKNSVLSSIRSGFYLSYDGSDVSRGEASKAEQLTFNLKKSYSDEVSFDFLQEFSKLKELDLRVTDAGVDLLKTIPEIPSLKKITLFSEDYDFLLSGNNLEFLQNFSNLKHLVLHNGGGSFPGQFVEKYCPQLEIIELSCGGTLEYGFNFDFSNFPNLKELHFMNFVDSDRYYGDVDNFTRSFSRKDYQELIDRGVKINIDKLNMEAVEERWQDYEEYYDMLNLDIYNTPMEKIDAISLHFLEKNSFSLRDIDRFLALTHMSGIRSVYTNASIGGESGDSYHGCVLVDVFGDNNYHCFDFWYNDDYSKQELLYDIKNGGAAGKNGYMIPLGSLSDYTMYNIGDISDFTNDSGRSK